MNSINSSIWLREKTLLLALMLVVFIPLTSVAQGANGSPNQPHKQSQEEHSDVYNVVIISDAMATASNIETMVVSGGELNISSSVYGKVIADPASVSHIRARFDGVITDVNVNLGQQVKKNDVLANIESNESLRRYQVSSPLTNTVIARTANSGELANGQILFSVANYDTVWVELKIFPQQRAAIHPKQLVILSNAGFSQQSSISHIIAATDDKPYTLAYVKLENNSESSESQWPIGAWVNAQVITDSKQAAVIIPKVAVQQYQDQAVVFVKQGQQYRPRPVHLGQADTVNIEVLSGLSANEEIVAKNSFLIKADLEKSEAGHAH